MQRGGVSVTNGLNRVLVFCTGGTIAGRAVDSTHLDTYSAGAIDGTALLAAVPELQSLADLEVEQICNVDSADLQFEHWRRLVNRIREVLRADPGLAGILVTHGTNTMEETAWLLQLLIDDPRPVVLVGAMRPATALSADGPLHLFQAVQVACSASARGHGVVVVMDGQIHTARAVSKVTTQGVGAFSSPGSGPLGWVDDAGVHLPQPAARRWCPFAELPLPDQWPQVAILHGCVEPAAALLPALVHAGITGVVFTGTGAGQLSVNERQALETLDAPCPLMLRSNRCGAGPVHPSADDERLGLLAAGTLSPQKARVLLLLALIAGLDRTDLTDLLAA